MPDHARVVWVATGEPWLLEDQLIGALGQPLNIAGNSRHPCRAKLSALRTT
jgi:hypothetical protein